MTAPILELEIEKYQKRYQQDLEEIERLKSQLSDKDQTIADNAITIANKDKRIAELEKALVQQAKTNI